MHLTLVRAVSLHEPVGLSCRSALIFGRCGNPALPPNGCGFLKNWRLLNKSQVHSPNTFLFRQPLQLSPERAVVGQDVVMMVGADGTVQEITARTFENQPAGGDVPKPHA